MSNVTFKRARPCWLRLRVRLIQLSLGAATAAQLGCSESTAPRESLALDLRCAGEPLPAIPLRRLTRFEYMSTLAELFPEVAEEDPGALPRDEVYLGFDNQADALATTDLHVEAYLRQAEGLAERALREPASIAGWVGCMPHEAGCGERIVERLGRRILRRPLRAEESSSLLAMFASARLEGLEDGAARVVSTLLQAPEFLYRLERATASDGALASPWVLASRLSFLIWASGPDEALLEAAASGQLASPEGVSREARRLLADPRARRGILHFHRQWLDLERLAELDKDRGLYPLWGEDLGAAFREETERFIASVLWEQDARLDTLLRARFTIANPLLAHFYALQASGDSDDFERIAFADGDARLGLLTQGAVLATQAKADQTSPILRGKFVRERFFCTIPPPPPPDLIIVPPRLEPRLSTRQRFAAHRDDPGCASCHELMDPIGLAFEHYDAIGRFRATEAGTPIDASGYLVGTDVDGPIDGLPSLAERLAASRQVRECVVRQWFRFAYGRSETPEDACTLDKLNQVFERSGGNVQSLILALTQTSPFLEPAPSPEVSP